MKKIVSIILLAGLASLLTTPAQTNLVTGSQPVEGTNPAATAPPAPVAGAATNDIAPATVTNAPPAAADATAAGTDTNAPAVAGGNVIPLIHFSDVPITTAIESLARQAGINYMLDPKIGYGQADQSGQPKAEPQLSIRWENITPENALLALLDNYGLQLVSDKKTAIARITAKDPTAPPVLITRVVQLKYADTLKIVESIQPVLIDKRSKVLPDIRTSQIVIVATDPEQTAAETLINQLDKPTRQVLIQAHFVEVSSTPSSSKGIDWTKTLAGQNVSFGNGVLQSGNANGTPASLGGSTPSQSTTTVPGLPVTTTFGSGAGAHTITTTPGSSSTTVLNSQPQPANQPGGLSWNTLSGLTPSIGFLNADGLQAVISFLNTSADAQFISDPSIVTLDNQIAHIAVTRALPVINVTAGTANSTGGSSVTYSNVGTILDVTPRILANDYIWLKVVPEISAFAGKDSQTIANQTYTSDIFDQRRVETQVLIPNCNTLVMGGLVSDNPSSTTTKVPLLGDIPGLGRLFSSETKTAEKHNLMIFITPTVLQDADFHPAKTDFFKARAEDKLPLLINPNSAWDSTKSDWSKLTK
jgi:type II secretory pathway component GspD/PulD (secretin)